VNQLPENALDLAILLYKNTQHINVSDRQIEIKLGDNFDFGAVLSALETKGILIADNQTTRCIEFQLPNKFFLSFEKLISTSERRVSNPGVFYLADSDFFYQGNRETAPDFIKNYLNVVLFYERLREIANHEGGVGSAKTLIFIQKEKLEITPDYEKEDLQELSNLDGFIKFLSDDLHKEQKLTIIRTVLLDMFKDRKTVPFSSLLLSFKDFLEKINNTYELYVSEFSFQKVKAEIEKEKLDATIKLNKTFSDVQNQLLAVPAALILVSGQMVNDGGGWATKNISIWLGSLIFAAFMTLLIRNQRHTLIAVKQEIDQQWQQIKNKHHDVADRFENSYKELDIRYKHQKLLISFVSLLVAIVLGASTLTLLFYSVSIDLLMTSMLCGCAFALVVLSVSWIYRVFKEIYDKKK